MDVFIVIPMALTAAVAGGVWWWRRKKVRKANEPKCPLCRSQQLDGIKGEIGSGAAVLGEAYRCRECGLERRELEGRAREIVAALEDLQSVEFKLAEITDARLWGFLQNNDGGMGHGAEERVERLMTEAWEMMARVRDDYPKAFEVSMPGRENRTAAEYLSEQLQEGSSGMTLEMLFDFAAAKRRWQQGSKVRRTMEGIRKAMQAEVRRRRVDEAA